MQRFNLENLAPFAESQQERRASLQCCLAWFRVLAHLATRGSHQETSFSESPDGKFVIRALFKSEIHCLLSHCGCRAENWDLVRLALPKSVSHQDQSTILENLISKTTFAKAVILVLTRVESNVVGGSVGPEGLQVIPPGVHDNTLVSNSVIFVDSCRVYGNTIVSDCFVDKDSFLLKCGTITGLHTSSRSPFGEMQLSVGPESNGGRQILVSAESTMIDVCDQLETGCAPSCDQSPLSMNIFGQGSVVRDTPTIQNTYVGPNASIEAATFVSDSVLLPESSIRNACSVSHSFLQWSAIISDSSNVSHTLLMEHAHVGPHSVIAETILGPDAAVGCGEIHASIIGPNTNAHHQSLLIGAIWPLGRGNVGYGANVGSNHTGRVPDQEASAGEGTFWGLSSVIKFPVDLTMAPYSVVAAGTNMSPQRICMPFSLILEGDIVPGWVLKSSPYTLARSEKKFATRRKAKRHGFYTGWKIFRPDVLQSCREARNELRKASGSAVSGIGTCNLSERSRNTGIESYTMLLQRYALRGLLEWLTSFKPSPLDCSWIEREFSVSYLPPLRGFAHVEWPTLPWQSMEAGEWIFQKGILLEEFPCTSPNSKWIRHLLNTLIQLENDYSARILRCKRRDDERGASIIPGYAMDHLEASKDPVVLEAGREAERVEKETNDLLLLLSSHPLSKL